jgi:uncharacterized protein (TIGR02996 family)
VAKLEPHPLMRTIVDHPDADLPRLVYADWLDEQGDPQMAMLAEYIRLSIEQESLTLWSDPQDRIERRLQELEAAVSSPRCPPMPEWATRRVRLRRGLPVALWCSPRQFAEEGEVLELAPITQLNVVRADARGDNLPFLPAALGRPELIRVCKLRLSDDLNRDALAALCENPGIGKLEELVFGAFRITPQMAKCLAVAAPRFARLSTFVIPPSSLSPTARNTLSVAFGDRLKVENVGGFGW